MKRWNALDEYIYIYVYIYIYMQTHTHICIYTHTHIYIYMYIGVGAIHEGLGLLERWNSLNAQYPNRELRVQVKIFQKIECAAKLHTLTIEGLFCGDLYKDEMFALLHGLQERWGAGVETHFQEIS